jgi:hypothetical protein
MSAQVLRGSKEEIAERVVQISGEVREAIVFVEEPGDRNVGPAEDIFAEMAPFTVHVGDANCSRETIYSPLDGE